MYSAQDVSSLYYFDFIYFLAVVLVGNYLELNLMVAVLKTELSKATQVQRLRMAQLESRQSSRSSRRRKSSGISADDLARAADNDSFSRGSRRRPSRSFSRVGTRRHLSLGAESQSGDSSPATPTRSRSLPWARKPGR